MDMSWRKSSHSTTNGGQCVEVGVRRRSNFSTTNRAAVAVRDTKDNGAGPVLRFAPRAWTRFTTTLK